MNITSLEIAQATMDMQSAYGMVEETNHISIICGLVA